MFAWIDAEKAEFPITKLCQYLQVSPSGFYAARGRPESARTQTDRRLRVLVRASFDESHQRYGSPRIHEDLIEQEERVSRKRVIRLMQEDGLEARARKRFKCTTMSDHDQPGAANLLDRCFEAPGPNQRWVGDTTEFVIGSSGKLYLAVVLDLFSRFVVGWAVSAVNDRHVTIKALDMALKRRCPDAGLLHHSDQGCTYASEDYQTILGARGIVCSMSRRGNCYDNADSGTSGPRLNHRIRLASDTTTTAGNEPSCTRRVAVAVRLHATDTQLGRQVALRILPDAFAGSAARHTASGGSSIPETNPRAPPPRWAVPETAPGGQASGRRLDR